MEVTELAISIASNPLIRLLYQIMHVLVECQSEQISIELVVVSSAAWWPGLLASSTTAPEQICNSMRHVHIFCKHHATAEMAMQVWSHVLGEWGREVAFNILWCVNMHR